MIRIDHGVIEKKTAWHMPLLAVVCANLIPTASFLYSLSGVDTLSQSAITVFQLAVVGSAALVGYGLPTALMSTPRMYGVIALGCVAVIMNALLAFLTIAAIGELHATIRSLAQQISRSL